MQIHLERRIVRLEPDHRQLHRSDDHHLDHLDEHDRSPDDDGRANIYHSLPARQQRHDFDHYRQSSEYDHGGSMPVQPAPVLRDRGRGMHVDLLLAGRGRCGVLFVDDFDDVNDRRAKHDHHAGPRLLPGLRLGLELARSPRLAPVELVSAAVPLPSANVSRHRAMSGWPYGLCSDDDAATAAASALLRKVQLDLHDGMGFDPQRMRGGCRLRLCRAFGARGLLGRGDYAVRAVFDDHRRADIFYHVNDTQPVQQQVQVDCQWSNLVADQQSVPNQLPVLPAVVGSARLVRDGRDAVQRELHNHND